MIQDFIQQATSQLGIGESDAQEATSGLLSVIRGAASEGDFSSLLSNIGGAEELMNKFDAGKPSTEGGLMGGLMSMAGSALGGSAGSMASIAGLVSQLNIDSSQLSSLGGMFFSFIKDNAGEGLANNLFGEFGDLISGAQAA